MSHPDTLSGIRACMQTTLKLSDEAASAIGLQSTAADLPGWTSMAHLDLVLALEKHFDVMFDADEIAELASVKAIVGALEKERPN